MRTSLHGRGGVLVVLLVGATLSPPHAQAAAAALFRAPFPVVTQDPGEAGVRQVRRELEATADWWRSQPAAGYDWVVPELSAATARAVEATAARGGFTRPEVVRAMLVQFYEIYAANSNARAAGRPVAPHWKMALGVSRLLARVDLSAANRRKTPAVAQLLATLYAHMLTDLPLVMAVLEQRFQPAISVEDMHTAFKEVEQIFAGVMASQYQDAKFTPEALKRAWPKLPGWLKQVLAGDSHPLTLGAAFVGLRRLAWLRFRWLRGRPAVRRTGPDLPAWERVAVLEEPRASAAPE